MSHRVTRRGLLSTGLATGAGLALGPVVFPIARRLQKHPRRNVVLVVADALRADALGRRRSVGGSNRSLTRAIDRLAARGLVFSNAVAPSSWTPVSMGSILYNVSPAAVTFTHGSISVGSSFPNIASRLRDRGSYTASINANWLMDDPAVRSGFTDFISLGSKPDDTLGVARRRGSLSAGAVLRNLRSLEPVLASSSSFFLYLHLMDTHEPYYCPDGLLTLLGGSYDPRVFTTRLNDLASRRTDDRRTGLSLVDSLAQLRLHYDAATMFVDRFVAALLNHLELNALLDDTLIIITSDHGEEFADNSELEPPMVGHCRGLTLPQIHSPLVAWTSDRSFLRHALVERPVPLASAVNTLIDRFTTPDRAPLTPSASDALPPYCLSVLDFAGRFSGFSLVHGRLKLNGNFAPDGSISSLNAFRLFASNAPQPVPLPHDAHNLVASLLGHERFTFDPSSADPARLEKLRALGYLN